jgi:hypothetical protein
MKEMGNMRKMRREHPNFAEIKFVVGASCSLTAGSGLEAGTTKK